MVIAGPLITLTGTSPASASTAIIATSDSGTDLSIFDGIRLWCDFLGGTGGTLDLALEAKVKSNMWWQFFKFTQITAGTTIRYAMGLAPGVPGPATGALASGTAIGTDTTPGTPSGVQIISNGFLGTQIRLVGAAGSGTSVGATQTIYIQTSRVVPSIYR